MAPQERRVITNGIWLCSDCSTLIDIDERRFSVEVLYRWKRQHEADVARAQKAQSGNPNGANSSSALSQTLRLPSFKSC